MKILHINYSDYRGGASRAAYRLHSCLRKKVKSRFYCNFSKYYRKDNSIIYKGNLLKNIYFLIGKLISLFFKTKFSIFSAGIMPTKISKFINESNYDLVHLHWIGGETLSIKDIGFIKKPIVWTLHDLWPLNGGDHSSFENTWKKKKKFICRNKVNKYLLMLKKKAWKNKIYFISPSTWVKKEFNQSFLSNSFRSVVIPNALDTDYWRKKKQNKNFKNVVGYVNPYKKSYTKGTDLFNKIILKLDRKLNKKIKLKVLGKKINRNFILKNITLEFYNGDNDKKVKDFYNSINVLLLTSRQETFCQVASEATSCGVPIVSFAVGGLKDIIVSGKNGFLVKAFNCDLIVNTVIKILGIKHNKLKKMEKNCIVLAKKRYDKEVVSNRHLTYYKKILSL